MSVNIQDYYEPEDWDLIRAEADRHETPFIVINLNIVSKISKRYQELEKLFPDTRIFYAVKANPAPEIIGLLRDLGAGFDAAEGELEFTTDGTCVNTHDGWKEMRIGIFAKRELGSAATPEEWGTRHLPRPHVSIAFAAIEEKDVFRKRWGYWANRLGITDSSELSILADGAQWIWDSVFLEFSGKAKENLDIYHGLEYLSNKGSALFGPGTAESKVWLDSMRCDLLHGGLRPLLDRVRL